MKKGYFYITAVCVKTSSRQFGSAVLKELFPDRRRGKAAVSSGTQIAPFCSLPSRELPPCSQFPFSINPSAWKYFKIFSIPSEFVTRKKPQYRHGNLSVFSVLPHLLPGISHPCTFTPQPLLEQTRSGLHMLRAGWCQPSKPAAKPQPCHGAQGWDIGKAHTYRSRTRSSYTFNIRYNPQFLDSLWRRQYDIWNSSQQGICSFSDPFWISFQKLNQPRQLSMLWFCLTHHFLGVLKVPFQWEVSLTKK